MRLFKYCSALVLLICQLADAWTIPKLSKWLSSGIIATGILCNVDGSAAAAATREIGSIATSGIVFKDTLKISAVEDPKVTGVTLYLSDYQRPLTEKLSNNFFNDPSSSSLTCARTGPMKFKSDINLSPEGEEVFEESRNLFFKQIRVRRIVDKETKSLVYVAYNTRLDKGNDENKARFKSSLCAVHIEENDASNTMPALQN